MQFTWMHAEEKIPCMLKYWLYGIYNGWQKEIEESFTGYETFSSFIEHIACSWGRILSDYSLISENNLNML